MRLGGENGRFGFLLVVGRLEIGMVQTGINGLRIVRRRYHPQRSSAAGGIGMQQEHALLPNLELGGAVSAHMRAG